MDGLQIQWLYNREATDIDRVLRAYMKSVVPSFPDAADAKSGLDDSRLIAPATCRWTQLPPTAVAARTRELQKSGCSNEQA